MSNAKAVGRPSYENAKHMCKYLVAIVDPKGIRSFVSEQWGDRNLSKLRARELRNEGFDVQVFEIIY